MALQLVPRIFVACGIGLTSLTLWAQSPPASYAVCSACHSGTDGALGPPLQGLIGRKAGSDPNFRYSPAMKRSKLMWSEATLDAYLTDPQASIPGNTMAFPGVADATQRQEIISYIKSLK